MESKAAFESIPTRKPPPSARPGIRSRKDALKENLIN
jgi:hypothetical protein